MRAVFAALADPAGVWAQRPGTLERAHLVLADWRDTRPRLTETETRIVAVLDELELTRLATSIAGLTAVGAAAIMAETGDLTRFGSPGRWRSTPGSAHGTTPAANTTARPASPASADRAAVGRPAGGLGRLPNNPVLRPDSRT